MITLWGVDRNRSIDAIKAMRAVTGFSLKDAKATYDDVAAGLPRKVTFVANSFSQVGSEAEAIRVLRGAGCDAQVSGWFADTVARGRNVIRPIVSELVVLLDGRVEWRD